MGIFDGIIEWFQNLGKPNDVDDTYLISELKKMDDDEELRMYREIVKQAEAAKPEDKEFVYKDEYVPLDDNTLKQNSYDKYSPDYESSTKAVEKNYDEKLQNIEKKENKNKSDAAEKVNYYKDKYDDLQDYYKNAAVKSGIADSSIMGSKKQALGDERDNHIEQTQKTLEDNLKYAAEERERATENKNDKLDELKDDFDKSVADYFVKLQKEEQKKVDEVNTHNEKTAKEEEKYKAYQEKVVEEKMQELKDKQKEMLRNEKLYGYEGEREKEYDKRYNKALDFYGQLPKKDALAAIGKNSDLVRYLGNKYYLLVEEIRNGK